MILPSRRRETKKEQLFVRKLLSFYLSPYFTLPFYSRLFCFTRHVVGRLIGCSSCPSVTWLVGCLWLAVGRFVKNFLKTIARNLHDRLLVGRSVCHNFLQWQESSMLVGWLVGRFVIISLKGSEVLLDEYIHRHTYIL